MPAIEAQTQPAQVERGWRRLAHRLRAKTNFAWWLDHLTTPLILSSAALAAFILYQRREVGEMMTLPVILAILATMCVVALGAWWQARSCFYPLAWAYTRLDVICRLQGRLSAARDGLTAYPPLPAAGTISQQALRWNWPRLLAPFFCSALILAASFLLPVSAKTAPEEFQDEPLARQNLQQQLEDLRESQAVQDPYLDQLEEKLKTLRKQPAETWYEHSSLEAADHLLQEHEREARQLQQNLQRAERSLNALQKHQDSLSRGQQEAFQKQLNEAIEELEQNRLKPNQELLEKLQQLPKNSPEELQNLDAAQLDQLRQNMRDLSRQLRQQNRQGAGDEENEWVDDLLNETSSAPQPSGQCQGGGDGPGGGRESPRRGPGALPDVLGQEQERIRLGKTEHLNHSALQDVTPGDLLQLQQGEHGDPAGPAAISSGGYTEHTGEGGKLIWKMNPQLLPEEKQAVQRFFR